MPAAVLLLVALVALTGCGSTSARTDAVQTLLVERLDHTPLNRDAATLSRDTAAHLDAVAKLRARIVAVKGKRTLKNTYALYDKIARHLSDASSETSLLSEVHPDAAVKEAARAAERDISSAATELSLDRELYEALAAIDLGGLEPATRYAIEKDLRDYRRSGVDKHERVRDRVTQLQAELVEVGQTFSRTISEDVRELAFEGDNVLAGLPESYIAAHPPGADGRVVINTTYPDYVPFMRYAERADLRKQLYNTYTNRGYPQNIATLDEMIAKRHELASLLGYPSWAAYVTDDKMIGSAEAAHEFIEKVHGASRDAAANDYAMLLAAKQAVRPGATKIADWEKGYWGNKVQESVFAYDARDALPYFEYERVRQGIFDISSELFGVSFEQVHGLDLWHEDVTAWDMSDETGLVGRFYLDMHPRPETNKYGHAACFPYRNGQEGVALPQATLVCNFPNPRDEGEALMEFGQVSTYFHEFGHLLHHLFAGRQDWQRNAGISTEWDFVEAPSQMLEEWLYDADVLRSFARHHETNKPIPVALVEKIRASSEFGKGTGTAHQLFYASLSLACYDSETGVVDTNALVDQLQSKYSPYNHVEGTHFQCNFGHLNGYSAIYYTYKWSEVIAKDMFSRFQGEGVMNLRTAREYRDRVLAAGSSKPAAELVKDFLGRDYDFEAFRSWLDGDATSDT